MHRVTLRAGFLQGNSTPRGTRTGNSLVRCEILVQSGAVVMGWVVIKTAVRKMVLLVYRRITFGRGICSWKGGIDVWVAIKAAVWKMVLLGYRRITFGRGTCSWKGGKAVWVAMRRTDP